MRKSIESYMKSITHDFTNIIKMGKYKSIAEYIISGAESGLGYYEFFDDEEIKELGEPSERQIKEFKKYLYDNYNYLPK